MTTAPPPAPLPAAPAVTPSGAQPAVLTEIEARRLGPVRRFFVLHPGAMDAVVVVVYVLPALVLGVLSADLGTTVAGMTEGQVERVVTVTVLGVVLGGTALAWRRRRPVLVAGVLAVLGALSLAVSGQVGTLDLALTFAVYAVAANRTPRVTWLTFGATFLVLAGAMWLWQAPDLATATVDATAGAATAEPAVPAPSPPDGPGPTAAPELLPDGTPVPTPDTMSPVTSRVVGSSSQLAMMLIAASIGTSVRNRRLHVAELVARTNALARERDQQARIARSEERTRIAREMHDVVAHSISVMIALSDGASAALRRSPDLSRTALDELSATGRSALAEMRRVLGVLDDDGAPLAPQPGSHDLAALVDRFRTAGLPVEARGLDTALPAEATLQIAVHRVVAEALTNALRHAPGTPRVQLCLTRTADAVEVAVLDDGPRGPVPDAGGSGRGLIGMRERAAVYGGTVDAGPRPEGGWRVHVRLPFPTDLPAAEPVDAEPVDAEPVDAEPVGAPPVDAPPVTAPPVTAAAAPPAPRPATTTATTATAKEDA
ncbi:sensor histidine kinase [Cellulomonas sp. NPDC057328]|uniref:sensor histidine kinase n=1 Tax=Cellulomonas sp. NPDC057328 TaxID=3346101 RepID=UPI00362C8E36